MTEPAGRPTPRPRPARRPSPLPVYAAALGTFVAVAGLLGVRMAQGHDPAVGAGAPAPVAQAQPARRVLVRRIIVTRRVRVITPASTSAAPAPAPGGPPASVRTAAPAPAPAPAPVQTATS